MPPAAAVRSAAYSRGGANSEFCLLVGPARQNSGLGTPYLGLRGHLAALIFGGEPHKSLKAWGTGRGRDESLLRC